MSNEQDRIRLAEAMGWRNCEAKGFVNVDGEPAQCPAGEPPPFGQPPYIAPLPDPFTDANDDYAVLEFVRLGRDAWRLKAFDELSKLDACDYRVGDYARAALKALESA